MMTFGQARTLPVVEDAEAIPVLELLFDAPSTICDDWFGRYLAMDV
jgi:hypothetical protein